MKYFLTSIFFLFTIALFAQKKLVDNSAASNSPANGPSYLIVSEDDTKMTYVGNGTQFYFVDIPNSSITSTTIGQFTESEKVGNTIFGRGIVSGSAEDLVYATTEGVFLLDYFQSGSNFPRVWSGTENGAAFGSGKFNPDNAGRDFIRVDPDLTTVTRPFNNVTGGGVDLINKDLYQVQMVPFAGNKILVKAKRTSTDEEYFVWDDINQTSTQITDIANSNADGSTGTKWPLGKGYANNVIFFYYDKIYTNDGTATGTTEIATATNMVLSGIGGGDDYAIFGNEVAGDNEAYLYTNESTLTKIDLNATGSSNPQDFISNGEFVFFIADTGDGYEPHISDGTISGTKLLMDINTSGGSMEPKSNYDINTSIAAGNGFVFSASDGTSTKMYFTDGENIVLLDNSEEYLGLFISRPHTMTVTEDYLYFTDEDKDVFQVAIPDNIYAGTDWSNGEPVANQSLFFNSNITISSDITTHSIHVPEGVRVTINNGATLTVDGYLYSKGTIIEDGGTLNWIEPISFINLSPVIDKVTVFLDSAQAGFSIGQYPAEMLVQLTDSLSKANNIKADPQTKPEVDLIAENLNDYLKEVLWNKVWTINNYKNNLEIVFGDLKQAQIKDQLISEDQIDFLLLGMKEAQVEGVRINIFGKDENDVSLNPNKEMFDYFYEQAKEKGFKVFANPAEFQGARRIANNSFDDLSSVTGITAKSDRVIEIVKDFALEYQCDYISPFNEDGLGSPSFSTSQVNSIFSSLVGELNGATLVGADNNNLNSGLSMIRNSDVLDHVSIATCHNLGFHHDLWDDYISDATLKGLPVWESEATDNPKVIDGVPKESRLIVAVEAGVNGLVFYNNWSGINLEKGTLSNGALTSRTRYVDPYENVTSITITGEVQVDLGSSITLSAAILPANATDQRIYWSSSDNSKATVDQNGVITTIDHGDIQITATAVDGSGTSQAYNVRIGDTFVTTITISGQATMINETTQQLNVTVAPEDATNSDVNWTSSDNAIAAVDDTGLVTAFAIGDVTITATAQDGSDTKGTFDIKVNPILATEISVSGLTAMETNSTQALSTTFTPVNTTNKSVIWLSDNSAIATVDQTGFVTAITEGTATITATSIDGSTTNGSITIVIKNSIIKVTTLTISGANTMIDNNTQTLTTSIGPENATDKNVMWESENIGLASVDQTGLVTALGVGVVSISATATDGSAITNSFQISISPLLVSSISITGDANMTVEDEQTLSAAVLPTNATNLNVTWSSSDETIAIISDNGTVIAIAPGQVNFIATAADASGITGTLSMTVAPILVSAIELSGNATMVDGSSQTLTAVVGPSNASDESITWSSSDANIATVDGSGLVNALSPGSVIISAASNDVSGISDDFTIEVTPLLVTAIVIFGNVTMIDGDIQTLSASVSPTDASDASIVWSTGDETIATVTAVGEVTAVTPGTVTISATALDGTGIIGNIEITIEPNLVTSISISGETEVTAGETLQLDASVAPIDANDPSYTWSVSNLLLASIDQTGLFTAIKEGTVTATATANDGSGVFGTIEISILTKPLSTNSIIQKVSIYPNPVSEIITVSIPESNLNATYSLVNISGKTVYPQTTLATDGNINVSNFTRGVYLLIITLDGVEITKRITLN